MDSSFQNKTLWGCGESRAYYENGGCELGIHTLWDPSPMHNTFTHSVPAMGNLELVIDVQRDARTLTQA